MSAPHRSSLARAVPAALLFLLAAGCDCGGSVVPEPGDAGLLADGGHAQDGGTAQDGGNPQDGGIATTPTVTATVPLNGATAVPLHGNVSATFSEAMNPATLTATSFTVTTAAGAVPGTLVYANRKLVFWPATPFSATTTYTATITTAAQSTMAVPLAANVTWSFATAGAVVAPGQGVSLGAAGSFAILAKSAVSTVPPTTVTGDVGLSPAAATYLTGFSLTADATNTFSTSPQVTGKLYAADYAPPTPANLTAAVGAMELAFTDAAGRAPGVTELGAGLVGGMTLSGGVYAWGTGVLLASDLTLTGSATDVWVFQIAQDLILSSAVKVHLAGGALARNVTWQVAGLVDLGTTAHLEGVVLCQTAITLRTGASVNGQLLAQTAVNLDANTVVQPAP